MSFGFTRPAFEKSLQLFQKAWGFFLFRERKIDMASKEREAMIWIMTVTLAIVAFGILLV